MTVFNVRNHLLGMGWYNWWISKFGLLVMTWQFFNISNAKMSEISINFEMKLVYIGVMKSFDGPVELFVGVLPKKHIPCSGVTYLSGEAKTQTSSVIYEMGGSERRCLIKFWRYHGFGFLASRTRPKTWVSPTSQRSTGAWIFNYDFFVTKIEKFNSIL